MAGSPTDPSDDTAAPHYSAEDTRGGEIVLKSRSRRLVFVAGLILALAVGVILYVLTYL